MRFVPIPLLVLLAVAGCAPQHREPAFSSSHPNPIVVRDFAFTPAVVTLDPTLGYSLHRGAPGVPRTERAEALGRAARFNLTDAISRELSQLGYDVVTGDEPAAAPPQRALVVGGAFQRIYEGQRHRGASVEAEITVDYQAAGEPQRLTAFMLDSRRLPHEGLVVAAGEHGEDVNYEATRLGAAIGRYVGELAQGNRWPGR